MALWLEAGSEPETQMEADDLAAINAIKESAAIELKVLLYIHIFYVGLFCLCTQTHTHFLI